MTIDDKNPPDDELEPTPEELKGAASLAKLVDRLTEGRSPPPAMRAEDRMLLDAATMIHASHRGQPLSPKRVNELVGDVLSDKSAGPHSRSRMIAFPAKGSRKPRGAAGAAEPAQPLDTDLRPANRFRFFIGGIALAVAASVVFWFMALGGSGSRASREVAGRPTLPAMLRSRSANSLLGGPIAKQEAGDASARIDLVYADRLRGYRELSYRQAAARPRQEAR